MTIDDRTAEKITEYADDIVYKTISEFDLFDRVYGPLPVKVVRGEWHIVEPELVATGVRADDVEGENIRSFAALCGVLNLKPSSLAARYGWPDSDIDAAVFAAGNNSENKEYPTAVAALKQAAEERAAQAAENREEAQLAREEAESHDADEAEARAIERGEPIEYFSGTREEAAAELGMPEDSQTVDLYARQLLTKFEAHRRAAKIAHRHEDTDYDALLAAGVEKEIARGVIR